MDEAKIYRLVKDTYLLKAGALFEERGGGLYRYLESCDKRQFQTDSQSNTVAPREGVEDNPEWFIEVFKVTPRYASAEELKKMEKGNKKK